MFNLYAHIEELGKKAGYPNIQQLCAASGVSRSIMTELNKGRAKSLSQKTAQKFADTLGISIDKVYGRGSPAEALMSASEYECKLLECWRISTDDEKETIYTVLKKYGLPYPQEWIGQSTSGSVAEKLA